MSRRSLCLSLCCLLLLLGAVVNWSQRPPIQPAGIPGLAADAAPLEARPGLGSVMPERPPEIVRASVDEPQPPSTTAPREPEPEIEEKKKKDPSQKLFSPGIVPSFTISIDPEAWRSLERNPRRYVEATVEVDDKTYERVGVHLKGAAGSFQPVSASPALTLKLDKFVPGQKLHGLRKIHLNNSVQDRTYLHELLAGELFLAAGVPAARATQARLILNRRDRGIYVLKEGFDKRFLRRHFKDDSGSLYDGGFCQDIYQPLENDTHRESADRSDLRRLREASEERNLDDRWRRLGEVLDVERFLTFMALEVLLWDWDGYPMKPNNYRIYHDPESDRLVFFPHGMDQLFAQSDGPILPGMGGLVARAVIETPAGKAKYLERLQEITAKIFLPETLDRRIVEV